MYKDIPLKLPPLSQTKTEMSLRRQEFVMLNFLHFFYNLRSSLTSRLINFHHVQHANCLRRIVDELKWLSHNGVAITLFVAFQRIRNSSYKCSIMPKHLSGDHKPLLLLLAELRKSIYCSCVFTIFSSCSQEKTLGRNEDDDDVTLGSNLRNFPTAKALP